MLRYLIMYLYKKKNGKKFDLKIARYKGLPYSGWTYQSETTLSVVSTPTESLLVSVLLMTPRDGLE